jgi:heme/copper-type cytochrome/quinol oxidase subunit 1
MRLRDIVGPLLKRSLADIRRVIIGGVIIAIAAAAALIELTSAARHYLEPMMGPVWARLILALAFILIAVVAYIVLHYAGSSRREARVQDDPSDEALQQRFSILAEAVGIGFSLGRDFRKAGHRNGKDADDAAGEASETEEEEDSPRPA